MEALSDFTLIVLTIAAFISIILGLTVGEHKNIDWIEGFSILLAVILVAGVTALNDWSKEKQFRKLESTAKILTAVIRDGEQHEVPVAELVVGDVVGLRTGDIIAADGVFVSGGNIACDESAMTGESDAVKKNTPKPFFLCGTKMVEGEGRMLVTSVGVNTEIGRTKATIEEETTGSQTPLEIKLETMAKDIGKLGLMVAIATVIVSVIWWVVLNERESKAMRYTKKELVKLLDFFILGVTILVVAIPEGLPLAVTISLAYSMQRMTKDKCLVRKLAACETCGGVTNICSDKTGTLTENKMTACALWIGGKLHMTIPASSALHGPTLDRMCDGIAANSTAFETLDASTGKLMWTGSKTESALLMMATQLGRPWEGRRKALVTGETVAYPFSSAKKTMVTVVRHPTDGDSMREYAKGAPEVLLSYATHYLDESGRQVELSIERRDEILVSIEAMASTGLRTLLLAERDFHGCGPLDFRAASEAPLDKLVVVAVAGIKDPLRQGVPEAVAKCKAAGIFVRMVTGDNVGTAKAIARECGIYTDGVVLEGPVFRAMSEAERTAILPKLQVIARSSPTDKYVLVDLLIKLGEVVAVTGDGTNDAAALAKADVGLAMGVAGTQVAKDAADIIILDDNFTSIVRAIMWGRSVYDSIRKFLQFQLTVNVVALVLVFVSACARFSSPLTPVQMLWVNLIMDTFAALALGTEIPTEALLKRKPYGRFESLINRSMIRHIFGGATFQLVVLFVLLFFAPRVGGSSLPSGQDSEGLDSSLHYTLVFNTFVFMQLFNEIASRKLTDDSPHCLSGIFRNKLFGIILVGSALFQALIVEVGGPVTNTTRLPWHLWLISIAIGALIIPWSFLVNLVPVGSATSASRVGPKG